MINHNFVELVVKHPIEYLKMNDYNLDELSVKHNLETMLEIIE